MNDLATHPISIVAARTGLSRDVLRVWERRYGAVDPIRTPGGQRIYSDEHIRRFRLLAAATRHGRNIGQVAKLTTDELTRLVGDDDAAAPRTGFDTDPSQAREVQSAMETIAALDGVALDEQCRRLVARQGLPWFLEQFVPGLMRSIGDKWMAGQLSIAHEHLASAVVLAIIHAGIRSVPSSPTAPRLLVATPSGERHAVGATLAAAAASVDGWSIVYLGPDVPNADIAAAAAATHAHAVALSIVHVDDQAAAVREVRGVRDKLDAGIPLLIGGPAAVTMADHVRGSGVTICESIADLRAVLAREASAHT